MNQTTHVEKSREVSFKISWNIGGPDESRGSGLVRKTTLEAIFGNFLKICIAHIFRIFLTEVHHHVRTENVALRLKNHKKSNGSYMSARRNPFETRPPRLVLVFFREFFHPTFPSNSAPNPSPSHFLLIAPLIFYFLTAPRSALLNFFDFSPSHITFEFPNAICEGR